MVERLSDQAAYVHYSEFHLSKRIRRHAFGLMAGKGDGSASAVTDLVVHSALVVCDRLYETKICPA